MAETAGPDQPLVAIVVVTWNGLETSRRCLRSLRGLGYANHRVCLVDNGSATGFAGRLAAEFPEVHISSLPENLGYAGGCNAGMRWARDIGADYVLLLNDDATVAPDLLDAFLQRANADMRPALMAPVILKAASPDVIWSAGGFIRRPWFKADHWGEGERAGDSLPREVEWASGCAMFVPLALVDAIGPMDDRYFLYLEDVEWCLRARRLGYPVLFEPAARVWHEVSAATGQLDSRIKRYYSYRNYYLLAFTHSGLVGRAWFAVHFALTMAKAGARWALSPRYRNDPWYHARTRAMLDVLRRRWGKAPYDDQPLHTTAAPVLDEVAV